GAHDERPRVADLLAPLPEALDELRIGMDRLPQRLAQRVRLRRPALSEPALYLDQLASHREEAEHDLLARARGIGTAGVDDHPGLGAVLDHRREVVRVELAMEDASARLPLRRRTGV